MKRSIAESIIALSLLALFSCGKDDSRDDGIIFGVVYDNIATKASVVTDLASFHVGCVTGTPGSSETERFNALFTKVASNHYSADLYWPISDPGYAFYASSLPLMPHNRGYTVAASNETDVVCAVNLSPTYKVKNTLAFRHIFARLGDVEVVAINGYTVGDVSITLTPLVSGTYDLFLGKNAVDGTGWSDTVAGAPVNVSLSAPGVKANDLYLIPGQYVLSASWTAAKGDYTQTFTAKQRTVSLVAGKVTKVVASFSGDATEIVIQVNMADWSEVTSTPVLN